MHSMYFAAYLRQAASDKGEGGDIEGFLIRTLPPPEWIMLERRRGGGFSLPDHRDFSLSPP